MLTLLLSSALAAAPEGDPETVLALRWGPTVRVREDAIFSDLPYRGISPVHLGLGLDHAGPALAWRVDLSGDLVGTRAAPAFEIETATSEEPFVVGPSPFVRAVLGASLGGVVELSPAVALDVGGELRGRVDTTSYDQGFTGVFGYQALLGLGPWARARWALSEDTTVTAAASAPLLSWVARSPWAANDDAYIEAISSHDGLKTFGALLADGELQSLGRLQALTTELGLRHALSSRWTASATLAVDLLHHTDPRPLTDLAASLDLGVGLRF